MTSEIDFILNHQCAQSILICKWQSHIVSIIVMITFQTLFVVSKDMVMNTTVAYLVSCCKHEMSWCREWWTLWTSYVIFIMIPHHDLLHACCTLHPRVVTLVLAIPLKDILTIHDLPLINIPMLMQVYCVDPDTVICNILGFLSFPLILTECAQQWCSKGKYMWTICFCT